MTTMLVTTTTFVTGVSVDSSRVTSLPIHVPPVVPFALLKSLPVAHRSGESRLNWDGTPAHSSGPRGSRHGGADADHWRQRGGAA